MKKILLSIFACFVGISLLLPARIFAQDVREGDVVILSKDEVIEGDFFATGETIEILGTVKGDVYVAGGNLMINGTVAGDVLAAGGNVKIDGMVEGDVRTVGGHVNIQGEIGKNLTVFGGTINITKDSKVEGSVVGVGGDFTLSGSIGKNAKIGGGNVNINGSVAGKLDSATESLNISSDAEVAGNILYYSTNDALISEGATLGGEVVRKESPKDWSPEYNKQGIQKAFSAATSGIRLVGLLSFLVVALLLEKLFPKFSQKVIKNLNDKPSASLGWGFLLTAVTPIALILLLITIIGAPLAMILMSLYFVSLYIAKYFTIFWAGEWITKKASIKGSSYLKLIIGLAAYTVLLFIPIIGFATRITTLFMGFGAAFLTLRKRAAK